MSQSQKKSVCMSSKPTPMIAQFLDVKSHYQDFLLFYRMGDFYEMFLLCLLRKWVLLEHNQR